MATNTEVVQYVFEASTSAAVKGLDTLGDAFNGLSKGFSELNGLGKAFNKTLNAGTSVIKTVTGALTALAGVKLGDTFSQATESAVDFYESLNLFQVAMKDSIDVGNEFIDTVSEWYGLDPKNLMDYTGLFYEMAYAVDMPAEAASQLSLALTSLSVDLASLFNVDVSRVADNMMSGIRGMSRAVLKYGLDLRATTVEAYANSIGITEQYETLNEASREILRYLVAVQQASDATGDFANTIETPANQLRIFKEQISQLGRAIGTFIVSPLQVALPYINGFIMALRTVIETVGALLGFTLEADFFTSIGESDADESITSIGNAAGDAAKKVKTLLAPFDELNVLQENTSSNKDASISYGSVDPILLNKLSEMSYQLEEVRMKALDVRDALLAFFGFMPSEGGWVYSADIFEQNLIRKFPAWQKTIQAVFDIDFSGLLANVKVTFELLGSIVATAVQTILQDLSDIFGFEITDEGVASWFSDLNDNLNDLNIWLSENKDTIANYAADILEFLAVFELLSFVLSPLTDLLLPVAAALGAVGFAFKGISSLVSLTATAISGAVSGLTSFASGLAATFGAPMLAAIAIFVAGFVSGLLEIWNNSETFRTNIGTLIGNIGNLFLSIVELVKNVVSAIWDLIQPMIDNIATGLQFFYPLVVGVVNAVVGVFQGLVDILNGLFTGDMKLVGEGFMKIIGGLFEGFVNIIIGAVNAVISLVVSIINGVGTMVYNFVTKVIASINSIAGVIGFKGFALPDKSNFIIDTVPLIEQYNIDYSFGAGGVVTGPTRALIGEAGRSEMVMPLDDSPQMNKFIDRIAEKIGSFGDSVVKVYIGDREWDAFTYESAQRGQKLVGAQPIREGRA